ncbi:MAG: tRNA (adenosine(37)-N6)-dimethylallyltransferase MiaA [Candidatus Melainabacteria bacterium GWF2_37_15]|nr:MAG: tRNA (adenosine(37)-N6)-dimethylallyltransferase MiaA [Candidatus Melainabacteria bacterium GWF2_37_15]
MEYRKKLIAIVGPTATGKTELAVKLAKILGGEIISADSRLVYRDFNIGTAKPDKEEMQGIPHYMIDVVDPCEVYTAGKYKKEAGRLLENISKPVIITGGTGFYIRSLLEGLDIPEIDPDVEFRKAMEKLDKQDLYKKLQECDPVMALKLHYNDTFRIIRALEVQHLIGKPMSEIQSMSEPKYEVLYVGLNAADREFIYNRINQRVIKMVELGLVSECESLIEKYGRTPSLLGTLGYREICEYLDGLCSLDEAIEKIQKNTRNFAKRQLTWFRANKEIHWFNIDEATQEEIISSILQ